MNARQQEASRQEYVRDLASRNDIQRSKIKRNYDELLSLYNKCPSYGITSTGSDWVFLRHHPGDTNVNWRLMSSGTVRLTLTKGAV